MTVAICPDLSNPSWTFQDLTDFSLDRWEPSYDTELWKREKKLHIYTQTVGQGDGERATDRQPSTVSILVWDPDQATTSIGSERARVHHADISRI